MQYKMNGFYNEDCLEAMKNIPDKYFELAIVDPPYGGNDAIGLKDNIDAKKTICKQNKLQIIRKQRTNARIF